MTLTTTGSQRTSSRRSFLTGALAGCAGGALGTLAIGAVTNTSAATETGATTTDPTSQDIGQDAMTMSQEMGNGPVADIGFCTDMSAHHVQALEMCERVLGRDTGDAVQAAATEVLRNQAIEVGMMRAWLADWGASTAPPETVMAWMSMDGMVMDDTVMNDTVVSDTDMSDTAMSGMDMSTGIPLADMPGFASPEELSALSQAEPGVPKGRMWLELMRAHHVGGVAMATAAIELASSDKVVRLATIQAEVQSFEIDQYDLLLATKYA